ncbi:hypothetical protein [Klebsiella michiganensis]|uniref:hypothetical protein n=1 Tax=Klebsiella michiganensis TaxID=1134687 RepID=UPI00069DE202|nr:hypothetical protein [Klebsiella michiganensis]
MLKDYAFVKTSIHTVGMTLKSPPLASIPGISDASQACDKISARLRYGIIPRPGGINRLNAILWLARMREVEIHGQSSATAHELRRLNALLGQVSGVLKACWIYRGWEASRASIIVSILLIIPAFLVFWLALYVGGAILFCSVSMALFLGVGVVVNVWIKDPVGLFWSLYSYIPLYAIIYM